MAGWDILIDNDGNPILASGKAFSGRRLALKSGPNINHPIRAIVAGAKAFSDAYGDAANAIQTWRENSGDGGPHPHEAVRKFESLCYKTAEFFDAYAELPKSVVALRDPSFKEVFKEFTSLMKKCSRDWTLICNKIKHNQNILVVARYAYANLFETVEVFSLWKPVGADSLEINIDLHKGHSRSTPLAIAMRQVVHDLVRTDRAAAKLIGALPDDASAKSISNLEIKLRVGSPMQVVENWPLWRTGDSSAMVDTFTRSANVLHSVRVPTYRQRQAAKVTFVFQGDGITRTFPII